MRFLVAILSAFALALAALAAYAGSLPAQSSVVPGLSYDVLATEDKMASASFLSAALKPDSLLVLGSSEFSAGSYAMAEHPTTFFREHDIGYSPMLVGSAHTQSLQLALYAGALAPSLSSKKAVLLVSPQWFGGPGIAPQAFRSRFSLDIYRAFLENPAISASTRERVAKRLVELDVDPAVLGAASPQSPIDKIDSACFAFFDDLRLRRQVGLVRQLGYLPASQTLAPEQPDWQSYYDQASLDGAAACANNDFGIDSDYYDTYIGPDPARFIGTDADVSFLDSREYDDLELFLDICKEAGLELLVVIVPVNGLWYDYTGMPAEMRAEYYGNVQQLCVAHGVEVADFSGSEDEPYFLRDVMHLGWRGWVHVEEAMYGFSRS
jgi:D-alanine transfer protein